MFGKCSHILMVIDGRKKKKDSIPSVTLVQKNWIVEHTYGMGATKTWAGKGDYYTHAMNQNLDLH